jgi:hypothetical protein
LLAPHLQEQLALASSGMEVSPIATVLHRSLKLIIMEKQELDPANENARNKGLRTDMNPGLPNRDLLSDTNSEAPIDKDPPMSATQAVEAGDETYEDEEMNDPDYFEKRAADNVRK